MPINQTSGTSCSIYPIDHPSLPAGLPSIEYKHHTMKSTITGAIQEISIIESNQGTSFEISIDIKPTAYSALHQAGHTHHRLNEDDYLIYVLLDGIDAQRSKRHRSQRTPTTISGVFSRDRSSSRSFQFGSLHLVDPDDHPPSALNPSKQLCQDEKIIQALGTIQVNIVRCTLGQPRPVPRRPNQATNSHASRPCSESLRTTNQMLFSERSKKACQLNTAGLSQPVRTSSSGHGGGGAGFPGKRTVRPIVREDPHPFLQFIFRYKNRSTLEVEGIIAPPPPPPHPSAGILKSTSKQSPSKPALSDPTRLGHDYQSNSELHKSSLNPNARSAIEVDEKKPKMQQKPIYIDIHSDPDCEFVAKRVKGEGPNFQNSTSNGTTNKLFPKPELRDQNGPARHESNNRSKQANTTTDFKKRARSTAADIKPNKRVSVGNHSCGTAAVNDSTSQYTPKTVLEENINIRPTTTTTTNGNNYRRNNTGYVEESSDDDDKFKSKILAPEPAHSTRPSQRDHFHKDTKKPSPQTLDSLNKTINRHIDHKSPATQGPNFFDLTGIHDDSD